MKKIFLGLLISLFLTANTYAAESSIKLPVPQKEGGMPLMKALNMRHTNRDFSGKEFDNQTISNVLWAAFGINREGEGKRTIPTAKNTQNLSVYAVLPNGIYSYDAKGNTLELVAEGDYRSKSGRQSKMLEKAAVIVVYVEKLGDSYNKFNTGAASQNVGLYATSAGLSNVVIGSANIKELAEYMKLEKGYQVQVIQALGYK